VPAAALDQRATWADARAFDAQAAKLAGMFRENFKRYADQVGDDVKAAGPRG
jgi:phosphoenolpyruvate carboxykinase (ATP)